MAILFVVWLPNLVNLEKSVLILGNASHHRKHAILDIAHEYKFGVIFLPKYSPDLNPIENTWANIKNRLRQCMHEFETFRKALCHAFKWRLLYHIAP